MASARCLDASVLVKLYVPEPDSRQARELVGEAVAGRWDMVGPAFLLVEVLSVLRQQRRRGVLSAEQCEAALGSVLALPLEEVGGPEVYRRAWAIAEELGMPVIYDAVYLAAAELRGATFWTADRKLFDRARAKGYVRLLGEPA